MVNHLVFYQRHRCPTALEELEGLRYAFLNQAYNRDVLQIWKDDGCYGEVHRRLGYRLVLKRATLPEVAVRGGQFSINIDLENTGYSAPVKERNVWIILRRG